MTQHCLQLDARVALALSDAGKRCGLRNLPCQLQPVPGNVGPWKLSREDRYYYNELQLISVIEAPQRGQIDAFRVR